MASVNDLQDQWDCDYLQLCEDGEISIAGGVSRCSHDLRDLARTAWHPVSEPPHAETDGDHEGFVLIWLKGVGLGMTHVNKMDRMPPVAQWARIRDVVLLPPDD